MRTNNYVSFQRTVSFLPSAFALLCTLILSGPCIQPLSAETDSRPVWFDVNVTSWHSSSEYYWNGTRHRYNDNNYGFGVGYAYFNWLEVKAGWFENSYRRTSFYGVANLNYKLVNVRDWSFAPGLAVGVISGYQNTPERTGFITPWGLLNGTVTYKNRYRATVGYLPSRILEAGTVDLITLQFSFRL